MGLRKIVGIYTVIKVTSAIVKGGVGVKGLVYHA